MTSRLRTLTILVSAILLLPLVTSAADLAIVDTASDGLLFHARTDHGGLTLTVSGPDGYSSRREFAAGADAVFQAVGLADGGYTFELVATPRLDDATRAALARARKTGDESIVQHLRTAGKLPAEAQIQSGFFTILDGAVVLPDTIEDGAGAALQSGGLESATGTSLTSVVAEDQVIPDDLIVQGSACVGFDCVNNESFGFDTVRLKENSLRIKFEDTSNLAGFPTRDWQLTANDSASGGASKFSIDDIDGARTPFTIIAGAPTNSLFVDSAGRVGLGTGTPVLNLHISTGNTPGLRLEQNGSSGFAPQSWDIAGNEANFFVRDVTNGSRLPLRIRPGAPTSSLDIAADGDVGIGTASVEPDVRLQVNANTAANFGGLRVKNTGTGNIQTQFAGDTWEWRQTFRSGDLIFDSQEDGANELVLTNGGVLTVTSLVQTSDRNLKENVENVEPGDILDRLAAIPIQRWNFTEDQADTPHLGPMAQDFYAAFGLGADDKHIAATDADGVALAAIQALYQRLLEKDAALEELRAENRALAERVSALEAMEP